MTVAGSRAAPVWNGAFERTWARTDKPVADLDVSRTWMWGPEPFTGGILEPYEEAGNGERIVQYFDKSRMEITSDPTVGPDSPWYVTNGLLATELITGRVQIGDDEFWEWEPAEIPVAGDPLYEDAPTYATFNQLLDVSPAADGAALIERIDRKGLIYQDDDLADYGVTAAWHVREPGINHQIASPFWSFMNAEGMVYDNGRLRTDELFDDPFYATGYPLTEAYWATVELDGIPAEVLIQCFERRCLTYTPTNRAGWEVEAGNIGQHYFRWRYSDNEPVPAPVGRVPRIVLDPSHDATSGGALGVEHMDVMRTALATKTALESAGYEVLLTRGSSEEILLGDPGLMPPNADSMEFGYGQGYAHTTRALELQPDLYISLHYNGNAEPSVAGLTVYYCDFGGEQNATLAGIVRDELVTALGEVGYTPPYAHATEDGAIGKVYGHLATLGNVYDAPFAFVENRLVGVPAVLTEPLFETNPTERALILAPATHDALARAYVRAVDRYFGRPASAAFESAPTLEYQYVTLRICASRFGPCLVA